MKTKLYLPALIMSLACVGAEIDLRSAEPSDSTRLLSLQTSVEPLRRQFNEEKTKLRVIALLSPTCGGCMHAARAVEKEMLEAESSRNIAVYFVWMPMLPSDNETAGRRFAASLQSPNATHFYDEHRRVGVAFAEYHLHHRYAEALAALPADSPLREHIAEVMKAPASEYPLWDAVLFFRPGVEWKERTPEPDWWARQVSFWGAGVTDESSEASGLIWRNQMDQPPLETDWFVELRQAMQEMSAKQEP